MPFRFGVPRTTHQWLKPLYDYLDKGAKTTVPSGASGIANATWLGSNVQITQVGNATGVVGFYGNTGLVQPTVFQNMTGITQLFSGVSGIFATGIGGSGLLGALSAFGSNGGTGTTVIGFDDMVRVLKNVGLVPL